MSMAALGTALILLIATNVASFAKDQHQDQGQNQESDDDSIVEQGFAASPIPENRLNLFGKDRREVGLGSYLVNAAADCNGWLTPYAGCPNCDTPRLDVTTAPFEHF